MKIFYFPDDVPVQAWYRAYVPAMELKRRGHEIIVERAVTPQAIEWADVVVFQGAREPAAMNAIKRAKELGKLTVCELNEDIWHLSPNNPRDRIWARPEARAQAEAIVRQCDIVMTATDYMQGLLRPFNSRALVVPTLLPDQLWPFSPRPSSDKVAVGWHEVAPSYMDVKLVEETMGHVMCKIPDFEFVILGPRRPPLSSGVSDAELFYRARTRIDPPKGDPAQHAQAVGRFDIGLAPLEDPAFDRAKCDITVLECAAAGVPCVASKAGTYADTPAILARNTKDWLRFIPRLIEDEQYRTETAERAVKWARQRVASKGTWDDMFEAALRDKAKSQQRH